MELHHLTMQHKCSVFVLEPPKAQSHVKSYGYCGSMVKSEHPPKLINNILYGGKVVGKLNDFFPAGE